jgi:hypothetical protein
LNYEQKPIHSSKDFVQLICPEHGVYYKEVQEIRQDDTECQRCQFLNPSRMFSILEEAQKAIKDGFDLSFAKKNKDQPEIFDDRAVYYRILFTHKSSGFTFEKIGIESEADSRIFSLKDFTVEYIDKIECTLLEAHTIEALYQRKYSHNKITIPNELGFNSNKTYLPHFIWQAKSKTIKPLRDALIQKQKGKCVICDRQIKDPTLDHMHQKKVKGTGRIRGSICSLCNTFIARSENNSARHGIQNKELPDVLRRMADYLEDQKLIIHPTEIPKKKKVGTREWNRVKKYYFKIFPNRRTLPKRPTYVTENWIELVARVTDYIANTEKRK